MMTHDAGSGYWLYFSIANGQDNGTITDFLDHWGHLSRGDIRKTFRP